MNACPEGLEMKRRFPRAPVFLALLTAGCAAHPIWVAGYTEDYGEVFSGQGTSTGISSQYEIRSAPGGIRCQGKGAQFAGDWTNSLSCDDGRSASFPITLPSGTNWYDPTAIWYAAASFPGKQTIYMVSSSKTESGIRAKLAEYKSKQKQSLAERSPKPVAARASTLPARQDAELRKQQAELARLKQETELAKQRAELEKAKAAARPSQTRFPVSPVKVSFRQAPINPNDIAVIIGNADYKKQGKDIPNVVPAYADAASFKQYVRTALGIKEGNIIDLRDATSAQLVRVFGTKENHRGQLFDWTRPGRSNVIVYYAGHGAPAGKDGSAFIVPSDADGSRIELNGYALATLYRNLGQIPAKSITLVLESCFSGASEGGAVISNASPVFMKAKAPSVPAKVTVISAGGFDQMASWEKDKSHGLFTKYFLIGMSGEADKSPYGNGDTRVDYGELKTYLDDTLTYFARRNYGRDQTAVIRVGGGG